jgi:hypothetical protein
MTYLAPVEHDAASGRAADLVVLTTDVGDGVAW